VRTGDRVTRVGDCRYAIFLTPDRRMDLEGLLHLSRRLLTMAEEPLYHGRTPIYLSASVGFCLSSRLPETARAAVLLERAQDALADALAHGPSAIRAYSGTPTRTQSKAATLQGDLSQAIEKGQITAWFQPQLCCNTGRISGAEALARWLHPDRGIVPPGEFLDALEAAKLTERLADVMLRQSLTALKSWDADNLGIPRVSVNFSGDELRNPKLADRIRWELDRQDVPPDRLGVEILETVIGGGTDEIVERNIRALGACGCHIDLDDFGTGDASLQALRRFDITRLKIDRSFISHIDRDERQSRVVAGILAMAETLGLETVAEGVEGSADHALLAQLGCSHVQGFGIARPMPEPQFRKWVLNHRVERPSPKQLHQRG
ncbi:MAG: GGDEF domain-containing phosphodiesterase, partial [Rhodobacteraceae bacterium]|nr:GGDEF domain-containing phosphodiesterase [Paracoccaceae bacterium]